MHSHVNNRITKLSGNNLPEQSYSDTGDVLLQYSPVLCERHPKLRSTDQIINILNGILLDLNMFILL
jgi:hypothetical protein